MAGRASQLVVKQREIGTSHRSDFVQSPESERNCGKFLDIFCDFSCLFVAIGAGLLPVD
jgi:hypothetical protein